MATGQQPDVVVEIVPHGNRSVPADVIRAHVFTKPGDIYDPAAIERDFRGQEGKDFGLAAITTAGENLVLCSGIMAGPKAIYARGGPGAKMGSLRLKAVLIEGRSADLTPTAAQSTHAARQ